MQYLKEYHYFCGLWLFDKARIIENNLRMNSFLLKRYIGVLLFLLLFLTNSRAQAIWELGVKGGSAFYLGDRNAVVFNKFQPSGAAYLRHNFNPRYTLNGTFELAQFTEPMEKSFIGGGLMLEFNFFEYGLMNSGSWTKYFSPYIFGGLKVSGFVDNRALLVFSPGIPMGVGAKWKAFPGINICLDWTINKLFNDKLDNANNPYHINDSGIINNDWYSTGMLSIGFDLGNRSSYCR